jgi:hypothetical protein
MNLPPPTGSPIIARIQNNSMLPVLVGIAVGVLLLILVFVEIAKRLQATYVQQMSGAERQRTRPTNRFDIRYVAREYRLTKDEAEFLFEICKRYKVPNARFFLSDYEKATHLFKTAYLDLVREEASIQTLLLIFSIYEKINRGNLGFSIISTTAVLRVGQRLLYIDPDGKKYVTSVVETNEHEMHIATPRDKAGSEVMLEDLSKINLMIQGKNDVAFSVSVRVLRYQIKQGEPVVVVTHSNRLEPFLKHEYVYIHAHIPCQMQRAFSKPSSQKGDTVEYVVEGRTYNGILLNYSGTSCNIVSKHSINNHQVLQLKVKLDGNDVDEIIVMVMNVAANEETHAFLLHANFVKISEKTKNYILAHVYSFAA